jgi:hypothetical protein
MKLEMSSRENVRSLFATPLAGFILPNASQINPGLMRLILDAEQGQGADQSRPPEGWHSNPDLAESKQPELAELLNSMRSSVMNMLQIISGNSVSGARMKLTAWASVYRARSVSLPEIHSESSWSGQYFVQAPRLGKEHGPKAGKVSFHDPRTRVGLVDQGVSQYVSTFELTPRDGLMLVYPSWMQCHLNAFVTDTAALLISFKSLVRA